MKRYCLVLFLIACAFMAGAQNLKALISHKAYCTDKMQPYIEFTFVVGGQSVSYVPNEAQKYEAGVEIQVDIKKEDSLVKSLHYVLLSDQFDDTARAGKPDFADIKNVPVPQGDYFLYFTLADRNADTIRELKYIDRIQADFPDGRISTSHISLFADMLAPRPDGPYNRYGYCLPPLYYHFVPEKQYVLPFAMEIYNTVKMAGAKQPLKAKCYIENAESKLVADPQYIIDKELETGGVVLVFDRFNVFRLPSGNYNLVVELYNARDSLLLKEKSFFQKSNPSVKLDLSRYDDVVIDNSFVAAMTDRKVLEDHVASLYPIATVLEREFFDKRMKKVPSGQLQRFFYSFWLTRHPQDPEGAWKAYEKKVEEVQERFGSKAFKGYKTDRGRVYLQYGQPNDIKEVPSDPVTAPYEIWHYYYLDEQSNVKFVFYDPSLTGNGYELLHSNKIGELNDPNWKMKLVRNIQIQEDIYNPNPDTYFGGDIDGNWKYH